MTTTAALDTEWIPIVATNTWTQLEVLFRQWHAIERLADRPGSFIYAATRSGLRAIALD